MNELKYVALITYLANYSQPSYACNERAPSRNTQASAY